MRAGRTIRHLIRDGAGQFAGAFDDVFRSEARRSFVHRRIRGSRTRMPNGGSAPYGASSSTGRSSGTTDNSNNSSTSTSSITTRTGHTAVSANAHQTTRKLSTIGPANRSDDTPPAPGSLTSTAKQPEPRPGQAHAKRVNFDAPTPPPHASRPTAEATCRTERVSGTDRPAHANTKHLLDTPGQVFGTHRLAAQGRARWARPPSRLSRQSSRITPFTLDVLASMSGFTSEMVSANSSGVSPSATSSGYGLPVNLPEK